MLQELLVGGVKQGNLHKETKISFPVHCFLIHVLLSAMDNKPFQGKTIGTISVAFTATVSNIKHFSS